VTGLPDTYLMTHQSAARSFRVDDVDRHTRLDAWFRAYGDRVFAYLLHRTDRETAQDVLQEVFVTAFRKAGDVPEPPIGWLFGTARRLLANSNRSQARRDRLTLRVSDDARPAVPSDDETETAVAEALAQLSPADREVLTLSAWYELSADQAAQALGCSRSAYTVRLHRARHRLADRLRAAGFGHAPAEQLPEAVNE
jgi:RNA polymerase sigma-70 factor (ECF subfamily)